MSSEENEIDSKSQAVGPRHSTAVLETRRESQAPEKLDEVKIKAPSFEEILEDLGCFGPYQIFVLCCYLLLEICAAFVVFIPIFVGRRVAKTRNCTWEGEETLLELAEIIHDLNSSSIPIINPVYSHFDEDNATVLVEEIEEGYWYPFGFVSFKILSDEVHQIMESPFKYHSFVDEWDLVCEKAWVPDIFTSALMAGMIVGNLVISQMADWHGRRWAYLVTMFLMFLGTAMSGLSPDIYFYAFARFLCGFAFNGMMNISCMTVMEFMTPKWRSLANCLGPTGEGIILLSILGYFIRSWRMLYLATLVPYLIFFIPIVIFLPESPRWLLRNKRLTEAHAVLCQMSKLNGTPLIKMSVLEAFQKKEELMQSSEQKQKISYLDFIRSRPLLIKSIYLFMIWFAWNVGYYGISYNLRNVPGDPYFNLGLAGVANAIGQRLSMPASDSLGRRKAVLLGMGVTALFLVTLAFCFMLMDEVSPTLILSGCFIGLLGLSCTRAAARLLSGETFPTAVRTMGLGVGGLGANFAGLVTPQIAFLGSYMPSLPFFIFAVVSVVGSLVVFMMKETSGDPLSDEVDLGNDKGKGKVPTDTFVV